VNDRMRRLVLAGGMVLAAASVFADTIPALFQQTKDQVKAGSWQDALSTMSSLEQEASRSGNEIVRTKLQGPLAFYRGVCEANLGRTAEARASFEAFLAEQPNAALDPAMYSKKTIAAFDAARRSVTAPAEKAGRGSPSLFNAFQEFKAPPNVSDPPDEFWADGPVRWIMTAREKSEWSSLSASDRAEFVERFWESRNPNPGNPDNVFKTTFERRVAFANSNFVQDEEKRGSMTDRGMVFVLLGPPTYGGRRPIGSNEDADEYAGMRITNPYTGAYIGQAPESNMNYQEVWHYRRELLPRGVGYQLVDVVFITRKAYGKNVMQRDADVLTTLEAAKTKAQREQ
jgi:GWxTD domain-containing protein